jgi:prepilin-type processing-associated H-X9-DG protein
MYHNSKTKITSITDGTAYTLAVGECIFDLGNNKWGALWVGMTGFDQTAGAGYGARVSDVMWWVDQNTSVINGTAPQAFSSKHTGGAFFAFCDGSVRFFTDRGDPTTLRYLAGRNDGVTVSLPGDS